MSMLFKELIPIIMTVGYVGNQRLYTKHAGGRPLGCMSQE